MKSRVTEMLRKERDRLFERADFYEFHSDCEDGGYFYWKEAMEYDEALKLLEDEDPETASRNHHKIPEPPEES